MSEHRSIHYSGYVRNANDFYATPHWVTNALLRHVHLHGPVWEPCCGSGAISQTLAGQGYTVVSTDIADYGYGTPGIDILECRAMPAGCRSLVTNPPYGDTGSHKSQDRSSAAMLEFVRHTLSLAQSATGQLALLVRLQWIAGKRAAALMSSAPLAAVVVLTKRIRWFDMGERTNSAQHRSTSPASTSVVALRAAGSVDSPPLPARYQPDPGGSRQSAQALRCEMTRSARYASRRDRRQPRFESKPKLAGGEGAHQAARLGGERGDGPAGARRPA